MEGAGRGARSQLHQLVNHEGVEADSQTQGEGRVGPRAHSQLHQPVNHEGAGADHSGPRGGDNSEKGGPGEIV